MAVLFVGLGERRIIVVSKTIRRRTNKYKIYTFEINSIKKLCQNIYFFFFEIYLEINKIKLNCTNHHIKCLKKKKHRTILYKHCFRYVLEIVQPNVQILKQK